MLYMFKVIVLTWPGIIPYFEILITVSNPNMIPKNKTPKKRSTPCCH
jgi:hypothetical protein